MKRWLMLVPLALILLLASTAVAQKVVVPERIDTPPDIRRYAIESPDATACIFGNQGTPHWLLGGWLEGQEGYKYLFYPWDTCDCPFGFRLQTIGMTLRFGDELAYPYTFDVFVDLEDALWDPAAGCWVPGIEDCVSPVYTITIDQSGMWYISLPIGDYCECAFMDYWYFLSVHFPGPIDAELVLDDAPTPCTVYGNKDGEWSDLFGQGFAELGNLLIDGEGVCCELPVDARKNSWGGVKALYR